MHASKEVSLAGVKAGELCATALKQACAMSLHQFVALKSRWTCFTTSIPAWSMQGATGKKEDGADDQT